MNDSKRRTNVVCLARMNPDVLKWLFDLIETDPDYNIRFDHEIFVFICVSFESFVDGKLCNISVDIHPFDKIKHHLSIFHKLPIDYGPFSCKSPLTSSIPSQSIHRRNFAYDNQIRNDLAELYQIMYGLNRPNCLPSLNEVIHLSNSNKYSLDFIYLDE